MSTMARRFLVAVVCLTVFVSNAKHTLADDNADAFFEKKIRPVLAESCFRCHGGQKTSGKLRIDSADALLKGGENGAAIVPGRPDESLLLKAIRRADGVSAMPPDKAVSPQVVADFEAWIKAGAKWPTKVEAFRSEQHWAFMPPKGITPPSDSTPDENPIDRFLKSKRTTGERNQPRADKRTLIRRATFNLTGLPPTPEAVDEFVADDSPNAFERLVDRLLSSPAYGERWARHWLDVVRYADTAGETADFPAPHAWRYRNYVINAFNADKPYDDFLREQIAGDLLARDERVGPERYAELITATGYLSISRRFGFDLDADHFLTIDDTVDVLGKSVLGLSIGCARCHDHKYDPISARDYYAVYGIFESTRYPFPGCEKVKASRDMVPLLPPAEIERVVKPHQLKVAEIDAELKRLNDATMANQQQLKELLRKQARVLATGEIPDGGSQVIASVKDANAKDTAASDSLDHVAVKRGEMLQLLILPQANYGADSTLIELEISDVGGVGQKWNITRDIVDDFLSGNPHADRYGNAATWLFFDAREGVSLLREAVPNLQNLLGLNVWKNGDTPSAWVNATDAPIKAWTTFAPKTFCVHPAANGPVAVGWLSPIDSTVRVSGRVADAHPGGGDGVGWKLELIQANVAESLNRTIEAAPRIAELNRRRTELVSAGPKVEVAYAVSEGKPQDTRMHLRGDPKSLGDAVPRGFLSVLGGQTVPADSGSGRLQLAEWLTSRDNPLTARVMVNRIWKHHFGSGLVKTPNDFGTRGEPPTHPELLDWLAVRFMESGWSLKAMHRLMMTSEAYVSATPSSESLKDQVHATRRRLSAEELRDAILAVSGDLDRSPGGSHPFPEEKTWGFTQHGPFAAVYDHDRRSAYLMLQRIKRHPFLALFDGPDASASTADRFTTTVPTQALFFLNDPFVHAKSESFARRLFALPEEARLDRAFQLLFSRGPASEERDTANRFLSDYQRELLDTPEADRLTHAWAAWLRVLMSSNEFVYVD